MFVSILPVDILAGRFAAGIRGLTTHTATRQLYMIYDILLPMRDIEQVQLDSIK
jgi:hypothetical protein